MTDRKRHISNSEIGTFKRCRRKWYLSSYRKLRRIQVKTTGPLQLGSAVHEALAAYYSVNPTDPVEALKAYYDRAQAALPENLHPDELKKFASERDLAFAMIEGYMQWLEESGIDDGITVLDSEVEMAADIDGLPVQLIGKFDTRIRRESDGALFSMDHKTCGSFGSVTELLDINEQYLTYQLLEKLTQPAGQQVVGGVANMLRKVKRTASAKPPFYGRETVYHSDDELRLFYTRLFSTLSEMLHVELVLDAGHNPDTIVPPSPDGDCSWKCEFRAVCPMMNDPNSAAEMVLSTAFREHDPYARYNEVTSEPEAQ